MRLIVQNVINASVNIKGKEVSSINKGFLVLVGFKKDDNSQIIDKMINKLINIRVFNDSNDKTNLSINDVNGEILVVSQFTLYASFKEGRRPSFINAANRSISEPLYNEFVISLKKAFNKDIKTGIFGEDMKVHLINDGPFTSILDSDEILK